MPEQTARAAFGEWGGALGDEDFAAAVAAIGIATAVEPSGVTTQVDRPEWWPGLLGGLDLALPIPWQAPFDIEGWERTDPAAWAAVWRGSAPPAPRRFAVAAGGVDAARNDIGWAPQLLGSAPVWADGAYLELDLPGTPWPAWRFPIRLGLERSEPGPAIAAELRRAAADTGWIGTLIAPIRIGVEAVVCDLLLLVADPESGRRKVDRMGQVEAGGVVLLTATRDIGDAVGLLPSTGADFVALVDHPDPVGFVVDLTRELSHDAPFDVAIARVTGGNAIVAGRRAFFVGQRASLRAVGVASDLRAVDAGRGTRGGEFEATALAADLEDLAASGGFTNETGDASTLVAMERRAAPFVQDSAVRRHLQARITAEDGPDVLLDGFRPGTTHAIEVRIAAPDLDWLAAAQPFPDDRLPSDRPTTLQVVLTEPALLERPEVREIVLPPSGPSTGCTFSLTTRDETTGVDARLIVLAANRVLQTARLPGIVSAADGHGLRSGASVAATEAVVGGIGAGLADRRSYDAAFVVNHDARGTGRITAVAGADAAIVEIDDVSIVEAVGKITRRLAEIVESPEDFETLESDGTTELLLFLAHHGRVLRSALVKDSLGGDVLADARHLQVVSARPDTYFPFEFAYDFPAPKETATLCPRARAALEASEPDATCSGEHTSDVVCPFGFWGIARVVERHAFQPGADVPGSFLVRSTPTRDRGRITLTPRALVAASTRVDNFKAGAVEAMVATVSGATGTADLVPDWDEWQVDVAAGDAAVLLLLPHTVHSDVLDAFGMEIGSDARTWIGDIDERFVPPAERPTLVALLGCETAAAGAVGYERFPAQLRRAGAEVVVATLTEVLGRHAAPVGARLVEALYTCCEDGPRPVGDVMLRLRRRLLADGIIMVLAVAVFGDADWLLDREGA